MKRFAACVLLGLASTLPIVGCAEKSEVKKETTVETPGGSSTKTETTTVEKTGDHKEGDAAAPAPAPNP
jgi:hypothetical protein